MTHLNKRRDAFDFISSPQYSKETEKGKWSNKKKIED